MTSSTKRRSPLMYILFVGGLLLGFVVLLEMGLRISGIYKTYSEKNGGGYVSMAEAPDPNVYGYPLMLLYEPGTTLEFDREEFQYTQAINRDGLRDIDHELDRPDSVKRIIFLGDSFTEGVGVIDENTVSSKVKKQLSENLQVEVFNAGVSGSDPFYCYNLLKHKMLAYQPDVVVLNINSSDMLDIVLRGGFERFNDGEVTYRPAPEAEWLYRRSHIARWVYMGLLGYDWTLQRPEQVAARNEGAQKLLSKLLMDFNELSLEEDFQLLIVFHPVKDELADKTYFDRLGDVVAFCQQNKIPQVDLMPYFLTNIEPQDYDQYFYEIDRHNNARGYQLMATGIAERLEQD